MEQLVALVVIVAVIFAIRVVVSALKAAARAAAGKGTFKENFGDQFNGLGALRAQLVDERLDGGTIAKALQVKGVFPIDRTRRLGFVTSVFDMTSGKPEAVISALGEFQEAETVAYQQRMEVGSVAPGQGFGNWVRSGIVIPQILQTPNGGARKLIAVLRLVDLDAKPKITQGFNEEKPVGVLWQRELGFDFVASGRGYLELREQREEALTFCVKIAMALAMTEGVLEDSAGYTIKKWIEKELASVSGATQERVKGKLNTALKESYAAATKGDLSRSALIGRLNEVGDLALKYEAIELCFNVMTAGNVVQSQQAREIDLIARALDLDYAEISKIRDRSIFNIDPQAAKDIPIDELLGIDPKWDDERKKRFLRDEWYKWNGRLTTLPDGEERDTAQRMLDAISQARKKYDR